MVLTRSKSTYIISLFDDIIFASDENLEYCIIELLKYLNNNFMDFYNIKSIYELCNDVYIDYYYISIGENENDNRNGNNNDNENNNNENKNINMNNKIIIKKLLQNILDKYNKNKNLIEECEIFT